MPFLFQTFPSLEYDSWMTIGISNSKGRLFVTPSALADSFSAFNEGGGFVIDSLWRVLVQPTPVSDNS